MADDRAPGTVRWLFADQLGPHFLDDPRQRAVLVESTRVFARRTVHRRKAHLVLSAMRHRAAELGDRGVHVRAATYREGLALAAEQLTDDERAAGLSVSDPTSYAARRFVRSLSGRHDDDVERGGSSDLLPLRVLPARGWAVTQDEFAHWAGRRGEPGQKRLLMEDFYREVRRHHHLLLEGDGEPLGGTWNYDHENREPAPRDGTLREVAGVPEPWWPSEDDVDAQVREDLDRMARDEGVQFVGEDGPRRFAVTRREALHVLRDFLEHRLEAFGTYEDAMLADDRWMAHSFMSVPLNLGLVHPVEVVQRAEARHREHGTRLASTEGFVRQVVGWREYVWHLYWHLGEDYGQRNELGATEPVPDWFNDLDAEGEVRAACLSDVLGTLREEGWVHHIPRLMVLGGYALARGWSPQEMTSWFHTRFVDGYAWVMAANVVGMSQHADGGIMATKPYWSGGAYIDKMSDYCGRCPYDPKKRLGEDACPFTGGYWAFTARHESLLAANPRTSRAVSGLHRLKDADAVVAQEADRGSSAP
ncbi:cryptochrome/photolyase family protein [Streptomyces sp. NP160]|uniref:cryptochrome/photolyase family protein n=1 Tax=Streptomyces sp. NP160 TaxID=2586637 RepID=UPI00111ADE74|nr:cryptochrome/photolyase family protein [Streptomyces sp. NP160]TNM68203.1 cryptochrome/photolyase family protein [Streptomyces sp. NP160]